MIQMILMSFTIMQTLITFLLLSIVLAVWKF